MTGNPLYAVGTLWIGLALVGLIVGAFFERLWAVMPSGVIPYLLSVWLLLAPGVVILWFADRKQS